MSTPSGTLDVSFKELHFLCGSNPSAVHNVTFTNRFAFSVFFKIRCTAPDHYDVRPPSGEIAAGDRCMIQLFFTKKGEPARPRTDKFRVFFTSNDGADFHFNMVSLVGSAADERAQAVAETAPVSVSAAAEEERREWTADEIAAWRAEGGEYTEQEYDYSGTWSAQSGAGDATNFASATTLRELGPAGSDEAAPSVSWSDSPSAKGSSTVRQRQQRAPPTPPPGLGVQKRSPGKKRPKRRQSPPLRTSDARRAAVGIARLFPLLLGTCAMLYLPRLGFGAASGEERTGALAVLALLGVNPTIFVSFVLGELLVVLFVVGPTSRYSASPSRYIHAVHARLLRAAATPRSRAPPALRALLCASP